MDLEGGPYPLVPRGPPLLHYTLTWCEWAPPPPVFSSSDSADDKWCVSIACQNVPKFQANTIIIIILGYKVSILFWLSCHPATFHPSIPILQKKRLTYFIASFWWNSQILAKKKHALLTCPRTWYTKTKVHFTDQTFVILPERNVAKGILLFGFERT